MKKKIFISLLTVMTLSFLPVPAEAQILKKVSKAVGGFLDAIDKVAQPQNASPKKTEKKSKTTAANSQLGTSTTTQKAAAKNQKTIFLEAAYPGGNGDWFWYDENADAEITLNFNRELAPSDGTGSKLTWGRIYASKGSGEFEGEFLAPSLVGDVYYFDVKSNSGTGRLGVKKARTSGGDVNLQIADVSGSVANWVKKGLLCDWRFGNGRAFDPTALCVTETELEKALETVSSETFVNYVWWIKNKYPNNPEKVFEKLDFEAPQKLIRPNTSDVRVRSTPSTKGEVFSYAYEWDILPVWSEKNGWYETPRGWISKTVTKTVVSNPITPAMMNTNQCGQVVDMDKYSEWRVYSPIGKSGLALCFQRGDEGEKLRLGKLVGNVFVFKYSVNFDIEGGESDPNRFSVKKEEGSEATYFHANIGSNYYVKMIGMDYEGIDLSKFNEKMILAIFEDALSGDPDYWYMTSELLTGRFSNVAY